MPVHAVASFVVALPAAPAAAWLAAAVLAGGFCALCLAYVLRKRFPRRPSAAPDATASADAAYEALRTTRAFLDGLADPCWSASVPDLRIVYGNAASDAAWGGPTEGLTLDAVLPRVAAEHRGPVRAAVAAALAGHAGVIDIAATWSDGTVRELHVRIVPIRDAAGTVLRVVVHAEDVSERKQREAAREALANTYRHAFQALPLGLFRSTTDGRLLDVNDALLRQFRFPDREAMLAQPIEAFYADPAARQRMLQKLLRDGVVTGVESLLVRHDGTRFWGRLSARLLPGDGPDTCLEGSVEDIDEQRRVGEALRDAEERYRDLVEMSPDCILVHQQGRVVFTNAAGARLFGAAEREQLIGAAVLELVDPEFQDAVRARMATMLGEGKAVPPLVEKLRRLDGTAFMAEVVARPLVYGGQPAVQLVARDVTARMQAEEAVRRSEARFRALMENSWDTITVLQPDGRVIYASPVGRLHDASGYVRFRITGHPGIHPDDQPRVHAAWEAILLQPDATTTLQFRIASEEGVERTLEARFRNMLANPDIGAIVINTRDLTDRVRLEEDLRQAQKMEAVGRLAGGVAHDFNNILTAITGHVRLLMEEVPAEQAIQADLREIDHSAQRATALTRQLLTLSRRQIVQPRLVDLNVAVAEMERMLVRLIGEHITLTSHLDPRTGLVRADPGHIQQMVLNLALNARDAMPHGGELLIATRNEYLAEGGFATLHHLQPGPYVVLKVSDGGVGIAPADLEHIFEPFFTTKEQGKGTGLGLSVVYGIARQSGGTVAVRSRPGDTEFSVYLPRAEGAAEEAAPEPATTPARSAPARILVVEDEPAVRALAARVLARAGHEVLTAESGPVALRELRPDSPPDLVLTDVVMPGMNGWELVRALRERLPALKIIYMSGYAEESVSGPARLDGSAGFLEKPFTPETLRHAVQHALLG